MAAGALPPDQKHLVAGTPRLLDVLLDYLKAYEEADSAEDTNCPGMYGCVQMLLEVHRALFDVSEVNRAAVRGAASAIRFVLDHPVVMLKEMGLSTQTLAVRLLRLCKTRRHTRSLPHHDCVQRR